VLELDARIFCGETPVDLAACGVASLLPSTRFGLEGLEIRHSPVKTLPAEYAQFDLSHVEPAAMLRGRDEEARGLWRWLASRFDAKRLVFIDESGFHTSMTRLRARAPRGERAYGKVPRNLKARTPR
jgi:hypothetical protein